MASDDDPDVDEETDGPEMVGGKPVTPPSDEPDESDDSGLGTVVIVGLLAVAAALLGGDDSDKL